MLRFKPPRFDAFLSSEVASNFSVLIKYFFPGVGKASSAMKKYTEGKLGIDGLIPQLNNPFLGQFV